MFVRMEVSERESLGFRSMSVRTNKCFPDTGSPN